MPWLQGRNLTSQICGELSGSELKARVERSKLGELRAGFVEPHLVNQLLEDERVVGKEIHAPFPVVKPDGTWPPRYAAS